MAQKVASIGRGLLVAGVGLFFILTPFGGPVLGAGISSTIKGIEKTIKEEKIDTKDYCLEVGFGAATGALTGGIGAVGEAAVAQTTKEVAKVGARLTAGTACSVLNKVFDESKQCLKGEKDLKN
jgi:hypothetical protein